MKSLVFGFVALIATAAVAQDGTTSVLANQPTPATETTTTPAVLVDQDAPCAEAVREVRLTRFQARRLERQADRQEAKAACECCKYGCQKKDCRPTALVPARKTACNCK